MSFNHKITDLKYRIESLVPKNVCQEIIEIFKKYPELYTAEQSYKYNTSKFQVDNFSCLNLSQINNPNEDILYALNKVKFYINLMVTNYIIYIKSKKISPSFDKTLISSSSNIRILRYQKGQLIKDHTDTSPNVKASCTLNLNEDYEGGEFRFFDGQIKESFKTGDGIIFPAETIWIHGTEPITKGVRYSINCFLKP
jgi:hypothetical protein